jgi:hypothetical protein
VVSGGSQAGRLDRLVADQSAHPGRIVFRNKPVDRRTHESRITQVGVAIEESQAEGLGHHVHRLGAMETQTAHVVTLENIENLADRDTAG